MMKTITRQLLFTVAAVTLASAAFAQTILQENRAKVHPAFRTLIARRFPDAGFGSVPSAVAPRNLVTSATDSSLYEAIVYTSEPQAVAAAGVTINSVYTRFVTTQLHAKDLLTLANLSAVRFIDPGTCNYPLLDVSVPATGAQLLHAGFFDNTPYTGKNAIVVIYDSGIDWRHRDFRQPDDTTKSRILFIWDQTLSRTGAERSPQWFSYGVEYSTADLDDELDGSPTNFVRTKDTNGHGTHVAGIAAGNGAAQAKKYTGMAPEADLIVVKGGDGTFSVTRIVDGLTYANRKASALGRPVVVNWSLGGQDGPHDGTQAHEAAADQFSTDPGRVVVVAAGNDGDVPMHIGGSIASGGLTNTTITVPNYTPTSGQNNDQFILDIWFDSDKAVKATVTSPSGRTVVRNAGESGVEPNRTDGTIEVWNYISGQNGKRNVRLSVSDAVASSPPKSGNWTLKLEATWPTTGDDADDNYNGWLTVQTVGSNVVSIADANSNGTVAMPATSHQAISVGSYVTKWSWPAANGKNYSYGSSDRTDLISSFSSVGPTGDGRQKPDLAAPGQGIASTLSSASTQSATRIQPGDRDFVTQGTSMAAPHVTGAVALLLGEFPALTAAEVKELLTSTADQDAMTGAVPNTTWGHGKLEVFRAMLKAKTGSDTGSRARLRYDQSSSNGIVSLYAGDKYAVRFRPTFSGRLTGITLNLTTQTHRPVVGSGPLVCEVFSHVAGSLNGIPGAKIGSTATHNFDLLSSGTENYISLLSTGVEVTAGVDYQIVLSVSNPNDTLVIRTDTVSGDSHASIFYNGQWLNFGDPASGVAAHNLRLAVEIATQSTATAIVSTESLPVDFVLEQNYPNPFNPATRIAYHLLQPGHVKLVIYDRLGRYVRTLVEQTQNAGSYTVSWKGDDAAGTLVASGVYFYRLETAAGMMVRKMLLLR